MNIVLGFVLINFNSSQYTRNAIVSINNIEEINNFEVVVVDNSSEEKDIKELKVLDKEYDNIHVIYSESNVGYFRGLNIGINYLKKYDCNVYVVGNNDVIFDKNFYKQICLKNELLKKYPVISPNIITVDGVNQNPHVISKISKFREFIYDVYHMNYFFSKLILEVAKLTKKFSDRKDELEHDVAQEIYQGYGAMYILTPKFFENFSELYAPTFLMYEEYFLSKQLAEKGFKVFYEPSIKLTHIMHATTNNLPSRLRWKLSKESHKEYRKYVKILNIKRNSKYEK
ncbi:putative rhamnosyl transferase [Francisella sp. W12-1067]|nr:putative rhamnosyl transferase [Francisella sp. W12-1067]